MYYPTNPFYEKGFSYPEPLLGAKLKFNHNDAKFKFRRPHWEKGLYFSWNSNKREYMYMSGGPVGTGVLNASDLERISLVKTNKKEKKMSRNVNYIGTGYKVVKVTYNLSTEIEDALDGFEDAYTFKTTCALNVGDMVVVEATNGYGICKVIAEPVEASMDTKVIKMFNKTKAWVVDKVDTTLHSARRDATERKKFLMAQLAERKEAMEEVAIYKMLAEADPDAAKLLEELESLGK